MSHAGCLLTLNTRFTASASTPSARLGSESVTAVASSPAHGRVASAA